MHDLGTSDQKEASKSESRNGSSSAKPVVGKKLHHVNGNGNNGAHANLFQESEPHGTETKDEKFERARARGARFKREIKNLSSLTTEQQCIIEAALEIISTTRSTWLVNIFKLASSIRSRELAVYYSAAETSFEPRKNSLAEVWRHRDPKKKNIKIYEAITTSISQLPEFLQRRISDLSRRVQNHRAKSKAPKTAAAGQ